MIQENETIAKKITNETDTLPYANSNSMEKDNSMEKAHPNVINIDKAIIVHIIMSYLIVLCAMYKIICVIFSTNKQIYEIYNQISSRSDIPLLKLN